VEVWDSWPSQHEREPPSMPHVVIAAAALLAAGIVLGFGMVIEGTLTPPHSLPNVATSPGGAANPAISRPSGPG
jgi:hypothetical protein